MTAPRVVCRRCRRPESVCYCAALPRIETQTKIVILQHPRERDMPIGTARMASLCLPTAELFVGVRWADHAGVARALSDPARPPILLYPGGDARDVLTSPPPSPVTLVVVDGTWSQAKTVVRDNPILHALPRYAFAAPEPSQYRIRREPRAEYCSTIEALMHVLGVLEGDATRFRALLDPLRAMVDAQLACQARAPRRATRTPRRPRPRRWHVPDVLGPRFDDLVLVAGEANAWPYGASADPAHGTDHRTDELVHWAALRPATGELWHAIAAPRGPLSPSTAFHTELPEAALLDGAPLPDMLARFHAWLRPTDSVGAWGTYGLSLYRSAGGALPSPLDLRAVGQRLLHRKLGGIETFASTVSAPLPALGIPGRAGRRLAMLAQIVASWRAT